MGDQRYLEYQQSWMVYIHGRYFPDESNIILYWNIMGSDDLVTFLRGSSRK